MKSYIKWIIAIAVLLFSHNLSMASIFFISIMLIELLSSKEDESENTSQQSTQRSFQDGRPEDNSDIGLIILCAAIMQIDRNYHANQYAYINKFLAKNYDAIHVAKRMTLLDKLLVKQNNNVDDACRRVMYYTPIESRYKVVDYLFGLAAADGHVSYSELIMIRKISEFLYVDYSVFLKLKDIYYKEAEQQQQYQSYQSSASVSIDYYSILQITKNASDAEVKSAYRKLVLKHHPDRWISASAKEQEQARKNFLELQMAYDKIKDLRGMN